MLCIQKSLPPQFSPKTQMLIKKMLTTVLQASSDQEIVATNGAFRCVQQLERDWNNTENQNLNYLMFDAKYKTVVENI